MKIDTKWWLTALKAVLKALLPLVAGAVGGTVAAGCTVGTSHWYNFFP